MGLKDTATEAVNPCEWVCLIGLGYNIRGKKLNKLTHWCGFCVPIAGKNLTAKCIRFLSHLLAQVASLLDLSSNLVDTRNNATLLRQWW